MKEYRSIIVALIAGISAIICFTVASGNLVTYKKSANSGGMTATGSASMDFTSDLIVWRGSFSAFGETSKQAYNEIQRNSQLVKDYLTDSGVTEEEMKFSSISISQQYETEYEYDDEGNVINQRDHPVGYNLYQEVSVTSEDVDKIENVSREITNLLSSGVEFFSDSPEYYYTKLDELKLQLIETATANAKERIDIMAANSGAGMGSLSEATLGVFQITAQNSDSEEYSYSGAFNTSSKEKTASITVRLNYELK